MREDHLAITVLYRPSGNYRLRLEHATEDAADLFDCRSGTKKESMVAAAVQLAAPDITSVTRYSSTGLNTI